MSVKLKEKKTDMWLKKKVVQKKRRCEESKVYSLRCGKQYSHWRYARLKEINKKGDRREL